VRFHSFTEPHLSTDNELVRDVLFALLSSLAKVGRTKISERTKAGLERARALGRHIGRLSFSAADRKKLIVALDTGKSWRAVSVATGIPFSTVQKHARLLGAGARAQKSS
jgi:DNA invertase Pin-like site-specific DNA recombinase